MGIENKEFWALVIATVMTLVIFIGGITLFLRHYTKVLNKANSKVAAESDEIEIEKSHTKEGI